LEQLLKSIAAADVSTFESISCEDLEAAGDNLERIAASMTEQVWHAAYPPIQAVWGRPATLSVKQCVQGKEFLLIYFSASWCPPCHRMTPLLAQFYAETKASLEIIFASSCENQEKFDDYFEMMPFKAFEYQGSPSSYAYNRKKLIEEGAEQGWLAKKLGPKSLPTLVVLDGQTGRVLVEAAQRQITQGVGDSETGEPDLKAYTDAQDVLAAWRKLLPQTHPLSVAEATTLAPTELA